ncbi:hypothetical protein GCM10028895_30740 [Pontibacter rugosus]
MVNDILIIGGGLAGLINALGLARAGLRVVLVEKKAYPFHKVCGEYISNEVLPYLRQLGVEINSLKPAHINRLQLTSPTGKSLESELDLGGFGVSRYTLDHHLYTLAKQAGAQFILEKTVREVDFEHDIFTAQLSGGQTVQARIAIGSYGKRSNLDRQLNRTFFQNRSPYIGVKYHVKYDFPRDLIALHNFKNGYAGTSAIENDSYCLCYLTTRENLKTHGSIPAMEQKYFTATRTCATFSRQASFCMSSQR